MRDYMRSNEGKDKTLINTGKPGIGEREKGQARVNRKGTESWKGEWHRYHSADGSPCSSSQVEKQHTTVNQVKWP